jgi:hypothetical protein
MIPLKSGTIPAVPGTALPAETAAVGAGGSRQAAPAADLAADLANLGAVLEYERGVGYSNVVGTVEKIPMAAWAARHLDAAGKLQADPPAAHECVLAARLLQRYAAAGPAERQATVAAAEAAAQRALQALRAGGQAPAAQQGGRAGPASQPQQAQQAAGAQATEEQQHRQQQQQRKPSGPAGVATTAAAAGAAAALQAEAPTQPLQQQAQQQPQQAQQQPQHAQQQPDAELDAAAKEAHAEESGEQPHTPEGEEYVEEYVMKGNRRIKASTAAFHQSFAEAAAAMQRAAAEAAARSEQAPLTAVLPAGTEQRSEEWLRLRERRLTASAFSRAVGLFDGGWMAT